jgi:hypothetical protein
LLVAVAAGVVFLAGLLISGAVGAALQLAVAALLVVRSAAAWPRIPSRGRGVRVLVVVAVLVIAMLKLAG